MSDPSVSERRIRPIQDAVATANWKQALSLCEKWAKKGERSEQFLALKAFVLVNFPDKAHRDRGHAEALDLCTRTPALTDPEAIYQLQDALKNLALADQEGPKLWERAVTAKHHDKDLYMRWINQAIADNNWRSAQKATMGLRKSFPRDRNYDFWNVLMCHLIAAQEMLPEKDRTLFGTLAYRMIVKAAVTDPNAEDASSAASKAIAAPEEAALLAQILTATGHADEVVPILRRSSTDLEARIGKQDAQLALALVLDAMEAAQRWDDAVPLCQALLSKPEHQSDDRIWDLWLKAHALSTTTGPDDDAQRFLDSIDRGQPCRRGPSLAQIRFLQGLETDASRRRLLQACKDHAKAFATKPFCFDDLIGPLRCLDEPHLADFVRDLSADQSTAAKIFGLKLAYASLPSTPSRAALRELATQALALYRSSCDDGHPSPEAVILAALAVLRMSTVAAATTTPNPSTMTQSSTSQIHVLFVVILLHIARSKSEDYYLFTVLLVQLQAHLGLFSLAMEAFSKLSVKNMQWETVGHLILNRISSLHPTPISGDDEPFDPLKALDLSLTVLENADRALVRGMREGLRFNSYSNIDMSVRMRSDLQHSLNRQIYQIEERKIGNLLGLSNDQPLTADASNAVDNRDFSYLPSYRPDDAQLLAEFRCGPLPKQTWVQVMTGFDHLTTLLRAELTSQAGVADKARESLQKDALLLRERPAQCSQELTRAEQSNHDAHQILIDLALALNNTMAEQGKIGGLLHQFSTWVQSRIAAGQEKAAGASYGDQTPSWEDFHLMYTTMETLQAATMVLDLLTRKPKPGSKANAKAVTAAATAEVTDLMAALEREIHEHIQRIKDHINAPGSLGRLVDTALAGGWGGNLEGMLLQVASEAEIETICARLKECWEDALDGVSRIKLRHRK